MENIYTLPVIGCRLPRFTGFRVVSLSYAYIEDAIPAIISKEDFEAVQEKYKVRMINRKHSRAIETYILKGKMFCGICGGAYVGARRRRSKDGSYWTAHGCNRRYRSKTEGCTNKEVSKPFVEQFVLEKLSEYVFTDAYIPMITEEYNQYLLEQNGDNANLLRSLQAKLKAIEIDLDRVSELLIKSDSMTLIGKLDKLEDEKTEMENQIAKIRRNNTTTHISEDDIRNVFEKIRKLLKSGKLSNVKMIIDTYINKIDVFPDKIIVYFNFFPNITIDNEKMLEDCAYAQSSSITHQHTLTNADDLNGEGGI